VMRTTTRVRLNTAPSSAIRKAGYENVLAVKIQTGALCRVVVEVRIACT
jgi:hypothetical protein